MPVFKDCNDVKETSISAIIIRANGDREELGIISYYHKNPFKRLVFKLKKLLGMKVDV